MATCDELWEKLQAATTSKSLVRKHLTPTLYQKLKGLKTKFGGTLADCIKSGGVTFFHFYVTSR
jgi:hypothetical protein